MKPESTHFWGMPPAHLAALGSTAAIMLVIAVLAVALAVTLRTARSRG